MDFLGIGRRTSKGTHCQTGPRMPSEQPSSENKKKSMHYLSRVTPQMIQKVLAFRGLCEEMREASSGYAKEMELFPQHIGLATTKSVNASTCLPPASLHHLAGKSAHQLQGDYLVNPSALGGQQPAAARSATTAPTPHEESSTQLTVFYNGTVNVYDVSADQAQAIMDVLSDNGNSHQLGSDSSLNERVACTAAPIWKPKTTGSQNEAPAAVPISESSITTGGVKGNEKLRRGELPLARKQSLQRFLEKRKERLKSVAPYRACGTLPCKLVEDKTEGPFQRWV